MPRRLFSSLRSRLLLLMLLAVIPALGLILYTASQDRAAAAAEAQAEVLRVVRRAASDQANVVGQARQMLVDVAQLMSVRPDPTLTCSAIYSDLRARYLQNYPRYANLGVIDSNGDVLCSVWPVSGPANVSQLAYFERTVRTLEFTVGDASMDLALGKAFVNFAYPVLDFGGRVRLVVFATLDLEWLNQLAAEADLPYGSTFSIVDQTGTILARHPDPEQWVGRSLPETTLLPAIQAHQAEITTEIEDVDGVRRLYALAALYPAASSVGQIYVSAGIPSQSVFAQADRVLASNLLAMGLVTVMAVLVTWVGGDLFVLRQVRGLLAATGQLAAGDLKARTGLPARSQHGELGQLAQAFDRMAETLEQRELARRAAEAALRESEALYRTLAHNFPNGAVILFDRELRYTIADGAGLAAIGLSRESLEGHTIWEVFPADTTALLEPHYRNALAGVPTEFEVPFAQRVYLVHTLPLRNEGGEIIAGMAMTQDITERTRAEEALRASEARFRLFFESVPLPIFVYDLDSLAILDVNPATVRHYGFTREELRALTLRDIRPPGDVPALEQFLKTVKNSEVGLSYWQHRKKDGTLMDVEVTSYALVLDGRPVRLAVINDVTERKQAETTLQEREEQYRSIFETVSDGLIVTDLDGRLVDINPAAARMHDYSAEAFTHLRFDQFVHADSLPAIDEYLAAVRDDRQFRGRMVDVRRDGTPFYVEVLGEPFLYRGQPHALAVLRDVTEEVEAQQLLEQRVQTRTHELATLLEVSHNVASTLELNTLMDLILNQLRTVVDYHGATIFTLEQNELAVLNHRGPAPPAIARQGHFAVDQIEVDREVVRERQAVIIADVLDPEDPRAAAFRQGLGDHLATDLSYIRAWIGVPLLSKEGVVGMLSLDHSQPNFYTRRHAELAMAFANHAAVAIQNARLFQAEQRRAEQFRVISEVGQRITSLLAVDELLFQTERLIRENFGYYYISIGLIEGDEVVITSDVPTDRPRLKVGLEGVMGWVAAHGEPVLVPDVSRDQRFVSTISSRLTRSELALPIKSKGQIIGVLNVESDRLNDFDDSDLVVLQSLANQLAVAIENARLYAQGRQLAALAERQKLARELHDSVSQALYGIALGARTARTLLDREFTKPALAEPLDYVLSLAEAGLAEMRALIFELRPESLQTEGLVMALTKQADSLRRRHRLDVRAVFCPEPALTLPMKEALYRIAQEAMHNIAKHARASSVDVRLEQSAECVTLTVSDDGVGFDPQGQYPGHLGLRSMRERAERVGGQLSMESRPGQGSRLTFQISPVEQAVEPTPASRP